MGRRRSSPKQRAASSLPRQGFDVNPPQPPVPARASAPSGRAPRSSRQKPWHALLEYKRELMVRDPLGAELTARLIERWSQDRDPQEPVDQIAGLRARLVEKYELEGLDMPPPAVAVAAMKAGGLSDTDLAGVLWTPMGLANPLTVDANWGLPGVIQIVRRQGKLHYIWPEDRPRPPAGEPPTLSISVRLSQVTQWDLARLARNFKDGVRQALKAPPADTPKRRAPRSQREAPRLEARLRGDTLRLRVDLTSATHWDLAALEKRFTRVVRGALRVLPHEHRGTGSPLGFLRTVSSKAFSRDLKRYDLHVSRGLSFRLIALVEEQERRGVASPAIRRHPIGVPVRGEDSVEASVQRIHSAIFRAPYKARRRRLDFPAHGAAKFDCPTHAGNCPDKSCPYLRKWLEEVYPTLPSDRTGIGPGPRRRST